MQELRNIMKTNAGLDRVVQEISDLYQAPEQIALAEEAQPQLWGQESRNIRNFLIKAGLKADPATRERFLRRIHEVITHPAFSNLIEEEERK